MNRQMKTLLKTSFSILLVFLLTVVMVLPCFAATSMGKITVTLNDKDKKPLNGQAVFACQIAELNNSGYFPTAAFENSGISISGIVNNPNSSAAKTVEKYVNDNAVPAISAISQNGQVVFNDLNVGIWLVYCDGNSKYTFNPFIVLLPSASNGKLNYEISSAPKIEDSKPNLQNIYVVKRWDDKNNASKKRPDKIVVELLNQNTVITSAELNESNGWAFTFTELPKSNTYSIREKKVNNYTPHYSGDADNGFIVTNTYSGEKLPQTGQYWWPIIIIAVSGAGFVVLGIYQLGARKNDKKK